MLGGLEVTESQCKCTHIIIKEPRTECSMTCIVKVVWF